MWRAFFFAIGIVLVILGLQCLVVDKFFVSQRGKLSELVVKVLNVVDPPKKESGPNLAPANTNDRFVQNGQGFPRPAQSAYGSSRFQSPFSPVSNSTGYGGQPFSTAGFQQASATATTPPKKSAKPSRPFATQDWMPWSLIAAGTLVVIYTRATTNSHGDEH